MTRLIIGIDSGITRLIIGVDPPKERKIFRLSEEEAKVHFTSFRPPADYFPGFDEALDLELLQKTNAAWQLLAAVKGFDWKTVEPHPSGSALLFYAVPTEN